MKRCLYSKCGKEFEPNKPKQVFCCATHRVYYNRENKTQEVAKKEKPKKTAQNNSKPVNGLQMPKGLNLQQQIDWKIENLK